MSLKAMLDAELADYKPRNFKDWLEVADPEDAEAAMAYINAGTIPANTLAATFAKHGIPCTRETVIRMREQS